MKNITTLKLAVLILFLIALTSQKSNAQCVYVTDKAENGEKTQITKTILPCNFPIYINNGKGLEDKIAFEVAVSEFKSKNPAFKSIVFFPTETPIYLGTYFSIPKSEFEKFSNEKQKTINSFPEFYHINP